MKDLKNRREPKKIKMPPLVDRTKEYDTMSWCEQDKTKHNENYNQNNSQSIQQLESDKTY